MHVIFKCIIFHSIFFVSYYCCTTFVVGKKGTSDGSILSTHSSDGSGSTDPRLVKIPAKSYPNDSLRPIFKSPENYPRYVGKARGEEIEAYLSQNCQAGSKKLCSDFEPIGYIPQVNHTFAYFEETYGIMNEFQVSISESTCSGVFTSTPVSDGGSALLSIDQLSQIAMERSKTARDAVNVIGTLSEKYGFYGEGRSFEGSSESLIISDKYESWVFHILASPNGSSSIWAAARVPDDHVAVVANMFSIREVDLNDPDNFLGTSQMWEIAQEYGLWDPSKPKDFTATFSDGEYSHKYYSGRRMWEVYRLFSPMSPLDPEYTNLKFDGYPFSLPVSVNISTVTPQFIFSVMRSHYNGTKYSTGYPNSAGGPYGSPERYGGQTSGESYSVPGNWERTISIYRASVSYVSQSRSWLPDSVGGVIWYGPSSASTTVYVPILPGLMAQSPGCLQWGWQGIYNLTTNFWAARILSNYIQLKYKYMIPYVINLQSKLESTSVKLVDKLTSDISNESAFEDYNKQLILNAEKAVDSSMLLFHSLIFTFADGYINEWVNESGEKYPNGLPYGKGKGYFKSSTIGYPGWWLKSVGYSEGPPPVDDSNSNL